MIHIEHMDRLNWKVVELRNKFSRWFSRICFLSLKNFVHMKMLSLNPNYESKYCFWHIQKSFPFPFLGQGVFHSPYRSALHSSLSALCSGRAMFVDCKGIPRPLASFWVRLVKNVGMRSKERKRVESVPQTDWFLYQESQLLSGRPPHQTSCLWFFRDRSLPPLSLLVLVILWALDVIPSPSPPCLVVVTASLACFLESSSWSPHTLRLITTPFMNCPRISGSMPFITLSSCFLPGPWPIPLPKKSCEIIQNTCSAFVLENRAYG